MVFGMSLCTYNKYCARHGMYFPGVHDVGKHDIVMLDEGMRSMGTHSMGKPSMDMHNMRCHITQYFLGTKKLIVMPTCGKMPLEFCVSNITSLGSLYVIDLPGVKVWKQVPAPPPPNWTRLPACNLQWRLCNCPQ